jgi:hypothetical protein
MPLADLCDALEVVGVTWGTFKDSCHWRLVTDQAPPEPEL